jgi:3,4-dihydroxy 2-butanone 4-phosphate synthase
MSERLTDALNALRSGRPILLYDADGREEETDMVIASEFVTPEWIRLLRTDGGGLLCTAIAPEHHNRLGLPWLSDLLAQAGESAPVLKALAPDDIAYDASKPSFGLTINHRTTFTGITDRDRATTISELATFLCETGEMPDADAQARFGLEFRAPGHVILLNGAPDGLADRQGHTELSLEMMRMAGLATSSTICEMMGPHGDALSKKAAEAYAETHDLVFLTGQEVMDAWKTLQTTTETVEPAT